MAVERPAREVDERPPLVLDDVRRIASFLSRVPPFNDLGRQKREQIAATVEKWSLGPGATLLVAGGPPATRLFVVFDGILELTAGGQVIDVVTSGGVVGVPTLVTGRAP